VELAREIANAIQVRDEPRARDLNEDGVELYGHAALVAEVERQADGAGDLVGELDDAVPDDGPRPSKLRWLLAPALYVGLSREFYGRRGHCGQFTTPPQQSAEATFGFAIT
jgi:hypothetical protein